MRALGRAVAWWFEDPDRPACDPVMLGTRIGQRPEDGQMSCTLLDPPPPRGMVVLHAVLAPGATRIRVYGVLAAMAREAQRRASGRWACYVTDGRLQGYVQHDSRRPLIQEVRERTRDEIRDHPGHGEEAKPGALARRDHQGP